MHCHTTGLGAQCAHPETRSCAHSARSAHVVGAAARTASLSRACHVRSQRRSRAQRAQVARIAPKSWAHVATSWTTKPGRDVNPMSRRQSHVATSLMLNQNSLGRDLKNGVATPTSMGSQNHVATANRCCDITQANPGRDPPGSYPMSRHQFYVATSFLPTVGFLCRDAIFSCCDLPC